MLLCCFSLPVMATLLQCLPCALTWDCSQSALFAQERDSAVSVLGFADNVLHNLMQRVKDGELWEAAGWQGFWLCLSVWNANHLTSTSLGSAAVHPTHSSRNAH